MARTYRDIPQLSEQEQQRFWSCVDKTPGHGPNGDCWIWTKTCHYKAPYGKIKFQDITYIAHRIAYAITKGVPDPRNQICHRCDNPPCCNPDHLWEGTGTDNMQDMSRKGRSMRGIKRVPETVSKGESHYCAKLSESDVIKIRQAPKSQSDVALSLIYNVRPSTIWHIRSRKTWRHVL